MAQWHVVKCGMDSLEVVVHSLVPTGSNQAGMTWKDAALKTGLSGNTPSVWVDAGEAAQITAGDLIELQITVPLPGHRSAPVASQKTLVQTAVTKAITATKAEWFQALKLTGYSEGTVI